jgi:hypothetical protein
MRSSLLLMAALVYRCFSFFVFVSVSVCVSLLSEVIYEWWT